ncbi:MAG: GNAT family N-acetyltransferase [Clostridia bacterium]|nr:GNAT family N-acetyltransferase [Clostridia bacterium]
MEKLFLGFYKDDSLIAISDLIIGYPDNNCAFIGWFVVDGELQGQGIGSQIFADIRANLKTIGINKVALGCVKENEVAVKFWEGLEFVATGEEKQVGKHTVLTYEREI